MSGLRLALVALLVVSTALFAAGAIAERSQARGHTESVQAERGETGEHTAQSDERETVLGVDVESTPLIVLAVVAGLALAALVAAPSGRRPAALLTIAAIAVAWAALDVREAVHQIDESRTGITILAIAAAILHLATAAVAARGRADLGSPGRPGTMPA